MKPIAETIAAAALCGLIYAALSPKPAADASPVTNTPAAVIAIPAAPSPAPAGAKPEEAGAGFVSLPGQPIRKAAKVASVPVRYVRQRQPVRSGLRRVLPRNWGRR